MTYQKYLLDMKKHEQAPMDEISFNRMMGIDADICEPPLQIRPKKNTRKVDATLSNYERIDGK